MQTQHHITSPPLNTPFNRLISPADDDETIAHVRSCWSREIRTHLTQENGGAAAAGRNEPSTWYPFTSNDVKSLVDPICSLEDVCIREDLWPTWRLSRKTLGTEKSSDSSAQNDNAAGAAAGAAASSSSSPYDEEENYSQDYDDADMDENDSTASSPVVTRTYYNSAGQQIIEIASSDDEDENDNEDDHEYDSDNDIDDDDMRGSKRRRTSYDGYSSMSLAPSSIPTLPPAGSFNLTKNITVLEKGKNSTGLLFRARFDYDVPSKGRACMPLIIKLVDIYDNVKASKRRSDSASQLSGAVPSSGSNDWFYEDACNRRLKPNYLPLADHFVMNDAWQETCLWYHIARNHIVGALNLRIKDDKGEVNYYHALFLRCYEGTLDELIRRVLSSSTDEDFRPKHAGATTSHHQHLEEVDEPSVLDLAAAGKLEPRKRKRMALSTGTFSTQPTRYETLCPDCYSAFCTPTSSQQQSIQQSTVQQSPFPHRPSVPRKLSLEDKANLIKDLMAQSIIFLLWPLKQDLFLCHNDCKSDNVLYEHTDRQFVFVRLRFPAVPVDALSQSSGSNVRHHSVILRIPTHGYLLRLIDYGWSSWKQVFKEECHTHCWRHPLSLHHSYISERAIVTADSKMKLDNLHLDAPFLMASIYRTINSHKSDLDSHHTSVEMRHPQQGAAWKELVSSCELRSSLFDGNVVKLNGKNMHVGMYIKASFNCLDDQYWHNYLCKAVERYRQLPNTIPPEAMLEAKTIKWPSGIKPTESVLDPAYFVQ